tara:strand:- start:2744 stop:3031 length:288 start_codon:yes stop_codon:yes gene_type:complete
MEKDVNKEVLKFYVNELKQLNDVLQHELLAQKEKVKSLRKDKKIVFNLKKMCRERTKEINRIYYGGHSSREQCNFDGQLEIMKEITKMTDRRKKI